MSVNFPNYEQVVRRVVKKAGTIWALVESSKLPFKKLGILGGNLIKKTDFD